MKLIFAEKLIKLDFVFRFHVIPFDEHSSGLL